MKLIVPGVIGLALACPMAKAGVARGPWELTVGGSAVSGGHFNGVSAAADAGVGYYFNECVELSLRQSIQYSDVNISEALVGFSRFALDLHLPLGQDGQFCLFAGVNGGYLWGQAVRDSAEAAPEAGIKYYVNQSTFIYGMIEYRIYFNAEGTTRAAISNGDVTYKAGIGFRF